MSEWWDWTREAGSTGSVYLVGLLAILSAVAAWLSNLFTLPGNWLVVLVAGLVMAFAPSHDGTAVVGWGSLITLVVLAVVGEVVEFAAGAAGAAKKGASKRAVTLSLLAAMGGSIGGAILAAPIPVVGPVIGAVVGGGAGAFGGAYLGEATRDTSHADRVQISTAAFYGRLLGTAGKLVVGGVMLVCFVVAVVT